MIEKFNLDSIIGKCVHRPISSKDVDKYPLYKRNDGTFDGGSGSTRSDAWKSAVERTYSSPNNIRRVFITKKGVYLHYYRPVVGDSSKETAKFYSYSSVNDKFVPEELARRVLSGDNSLSISKFGFGAFKGMWSCSNIEEIYVDWTILLSDDIRAFGLTGLLNTINSGKSGWDDKMGYSLWQLFERSCLSSGEKCNKTFPRLKYIVYINRLDEVYNMIKRKPGEESVEDMRNPWWKNPIVDRAVNSANVYTARYIVPNVTKEYNNAYITRSFYSFDVEVLIPYFEDRKNKILKAQIEARKNAEANKSDFEKLLDSVKVKKGVEAAKKMCNILLMTDPAHREENIASLSDAGRALYLGGNK